MLSEVEFSRDFVKFVTKVVEKNKFAVKLSGRQAASMNLDLADRLGFQGDDKRSLDTISTYLLTYFLHVS